MNRPISNSVLPTRWMKNVTFAAGSVCIELAAYYERRTIKTKATFFSPTVMIRKAKSRITAFSLFKSWHPANSRNGCSPKGNCLQSKINRSLPPVLTLSMRMCNEHPEVWIMKIRLTHYTFGRRSMTGANGKDNYLAWAPLFHSNTVNDCLFVCFCYTYKGK